jgi:thioredoxin reductase (NADPH)
MKRRKTSNEVDCAIIGGGPGGLISALYLKRFKRSVVMINSGKPRASWGHKVNNLIGYHEGISGRTLLARITKQLLKVGDVERIEGEAKIMRLRRNDGFEVLISTGKTVRARKVILATGIEDEHPKLTNLDRLRKLGLLKYCSICDGYEQRNRPVIVIAKNDSGIEKAFFIANWTKNITVIVPSDFKLAPRRISELKSIHAKMIKCDVLTVTPSQDLKNIWVSADLNPKFLASVAYVELGCKVRDTAFGHLKALRRSKEGFIIATTEQRTSIPGLFAVGDCVNLLGQISVAAGQAAVAATTIHNDLL